MSTERQEYSIANQQAAIAQYAEQHGYQIVCTYTDAAKSGLDLAHRPGLRKMLEDVLTMQAQYEAILVYDVSRWGRFQDTDESAYYEFLCKKASVRVHYCAEPFPNDDTTVSAILKTLKRVMAGEYSRELSAKVFAGQCRIVNAGYKMGGRPGYGLRRVLLDKDGNSKGLLQSGEKKNLQSDHVSLVPGPPEEVRVVRQIYSLFVRGMSIKAIVRSLNARHIPRDIPGPWCYRTVYQILTHRKYTGALVFNQTSTKMHSKFKRNPREQWLIRPRSFTAIVSERVFARAQRQFRNRAGTASDREFLDDLRTLLKRRGVLNEKIIDAELVGACSRTIRERFGGLMRLYELLAYDSQRKLSFVALCFRSKVIRRAVTDVLIGTFAKAGIHVIEEERHLVLEGVARVRFELAVCQLFEHRNLGWKVRLPGGSTPDPLIVVRLREGNLEILDYVLLDSCPVRRESFRLHDGHLTNHTKGSAYQIVNEIISRMKKAKSQTADESNPEG
jgi:DNA invertase Pin-like site-specific DNA recombinase